MSNKTSIEVLGAHTHNLKGIDCRVPHRKVTVVTGPSGAGKSSLAFDTVFAEGQRRFVESMSTYARQFLSQMERPPVEEIRNILPPVAIEAKNSVKNARSTVGTLSEVHDVLRLLFTHLGQVECPNGHGLVEPLAVEQMVDQLSSGVVGARFTLVAPIPRPKKDANKALAELVRQGYSRVMDGDEVARLTSSSRWPTKWNPLALALGRFKSGAEKVARIAEAVEEGLRLGLGQVEARGADGAVRYYGRSLRCTECGTAAKRPTPALFSFNSPLGACDTCQGFGRVIGVDPGRVIPDPSKTLRQRPIAPWNSPAYEDRYDKLYAVCAALGVPLDTPWNELTEEQRRWIWSGEGPFTSLDKFFSWLERRSYKVHVRVMLARYRAYDQCRDCGGDRLCPEALAVRLGGLSIAELCSWPIEQLKSWLAERSWTEREVARSGHLIEQLTERVGVLDRVGLGYLTLARQARTLSGGEAQRIYLAAALGSGLTETLYVLDEPTIGLHSRDSDRLLRLLHDLARRGNTVLVVEHDRTVIGGADHIIDLGPAAGEYGGELIVEGPIETILETAESETGKYLRRRPRTEARRHLEQFRREQGRESLDQELVGLPSVTLRGVRANNLKNFDVTFPLGTMVAVTGVSGSGKSTLIENVLYGNYQRQRGKVDVDPGPCDGLDGLDELEEVVLVDQRPIGKSSRSNLLTYLKAYDEVRKLFAATPVAKRDGITAGHFSFNLEKGRCGKCEGTGWVEVDMQFMSDVTVVCEDCSGKRFQSHVLAARYQGLNIAETLELSVVQALEHFAGSKKICTRLQNLLDVGLGYLRLGQSTATFSGGEAQRLKLASFLERSSKQQPRLFLFDEPTTGLHMSDIDLLCQTLRRLVQSGDSVLVVEHSIDLIFHADWIVELGPGGGTHGGELLFSGPVQRFLSEIDSPTADELRGFLGIAVPS